MLRTCFLTILLLIGWPAQAQSQIDGELLGIDETTLKSLFPDIKRLARPVMGPHRVRGIWRLEKTQVADVLLDATFFISRHHVVRIEQQGALDQPVCPATMTDTGVMAELSARYGPGLAANNSDARGNVQRSLVWVTAGTNVMLFLTQQPQQCDLLLVYQPHIEVDASEL